MQVTAQHFDSRLLIQQSNLTAPKFNKNTGKMFCWTLALSLLFID